MGIGKNNHVGIWQYQYPKTITGPVSLPLPTYTYTVSPTGYIQLNLDFPYGSLEYDNEAIQSKIRVGDEEGYECTDCQEFYPMAELNQPDNAKEYLTFTCYGCRKGLKTCFEK